MAKFAANRNTVTKEKIAERGKIFDVNGDTIHFDEKQELKEYVAGLKKK